MQVFSIKICGPLLEIIQIIKKLTAPLEPNPEATCRGEEMAWCHKARIPAPLLGRLLPELAQHQDVLCFCLVLCSLAVHTDY